MRGFTNISTLLIFFCTAFRLYSQGPYSFSIKNSLAMCAAAGATLEVSGTGSHDTVTVKWSNGQVAPAAAGLNSGDHWVEVSIKYHDTIAHVIDTVIYFSIGKELCQITVSRYFSPNDDNYNDFLGIGNVERHPDFELHIYNKWGQRVHHQKNTYIPWDGKWNGVNLPDGTYYFVFFYDAKDRNKLEKGDITILR